tara:strand:- start:198 stop:380 length:183 start_codon:yes stop_codon:yes gene_type:complete
MYAVIRFRFELMSARFERAFNRLVRMFAQHVMKERPFCREQVVAFSTLDVALAMSSGNMH